MKQGRDHAENGALRAQAFFGEMGAIVTDDQSRHRQRSIERVLQVVINRVATVVARELTVEQPLEIAERGLDPVERIVRPALPEQIDHRTTDRVG
jgi:hypothetical protein